MVLFELSFPNKGSWDNHWSRENEKHIVAMADKYVKPELIDKNYFYDFGDGWGANVKVYKMSGNTNEYRAILKNNTGFCGYEWMVRSIVKNGEIQK